MLTGLLVTWRPRYSPRSPLENDSVRSAQSCGLQLPTSLRKLRLRYFVSIRIDGTESVLGPDWVRWRGRLHLVRPLNRRIFGSDALLHVYRLGPQNSNALTYFIKNTCFFISTSWSCFWWAGDPKSSPNMDQAMYFGCTGTISRGF